MMKKLLQTLFFTLLAGTTLVACGTTTKNIHGQVIQQKNIAAVKPGASKDHVRRLLGSPSTVAAFDTEKWLYITAEIDQKPFGIEELKDRRVYVITFEDDVVTSVKERTDKDGQNITPDKAITSTQGQSMGVIQQMMANVTSSIK